MPAEASIRFRAESQQARREVQTLRGTLAQLNKTLAEQRNQLIGATAEEQKNIRAHIAANNALKTTIRSQIEQTNLRKQAIAQTQREAKERERLAQQQVREAQRVGKAQEQAARRASAAQSALIADLTIGARVVYRELSRLTTGFVGAAANMETFRNSVQAVTGDATETNRILADLLQLTVELVGIDTGTLISYAGRLMASGLSAEEAITAIRGVTERIAEQGKAASVTARVMEQVTQSFNAGIATMQDFRPILREMPTFWRDASNALGVQIRSLEDFRQATEAAGGNTQALLRVLEEMGRASEGANLDTLNAQIDILQDQSQLLSAELGEHLIPAIVSIVKEVNVWIESFRNMDDQGQAAIAWAAALATGITGLVAVVGTATVAFGVFSSSVAAITGTAGLGGVATLAGQAAGGLGRVVGILGRLGSVGNLAATAGITLAQAWQQIYNDFQRTPPFEDAVESIQALNLASSQTARSLGLTAESLSGLSQESRTEIGLLISRADELRTSIRNAVNAGDTEALSGFRNEYRQVTQQLESLTTALPPTVEGIQAAEAALSGLAEVSPAVVRFQKELTGEIITAEQAHRNLTAVVDSTKLPYNDFQSRIQASALAVARFTGVIEGVAEPFTAYTAATHLSTAALEEEAKALATVTQRIIQQTQDAEALVHIQEVLTERTDAHNAALVNPIVTQAAQRIRAYATALDSTQFSTQALTEITSDSMDRIREFTDAVLTSEGVLNNFAPALGEVETRYIGLESVTDRLTASIRDQASAFDELRQKVERFNQSESQRRQQRGIQPPRLPGETITSERALGDLDRLFGTDPRSRSRQEESEKAAIEAQRESIQLYNDLSVAIVDFTGSLIDLKGETNLADHAFQDFLGTFGRLATGDFTALLDIPIQLLNISRQAAAEREQGARDRAALYEEQFGEFERFGRNFDVVSGVLGIPESPELSDSLFFNPAGEFENVLAQSTADFSDGIKNALLSSVVNLERDIRPEDIAGIFQSSIDALGENLDQSQFNLNFDQQLGRDTADAYQSLINDTTTFYQAQIDAINLVRQATGNLSFGDPEALARQAQAETNQLRLAAPPSGPQNAQQFLAASNRTRGLTEPTDDQERGLTSAEVARVDDEVLAAALQANQESIAAINTAIAGLDASISQSNDPVSEIEQLLQQIAIQIPERYRLRREALQQQLDAGDITQAAFDTSLAQLGIDESAELERNSDAMLENALLINRQAIEAINVQVVGLENAISQSNDPAEIESLLLQIAQQIPEIYRLRREALSQQFAAGEITLQSFNTSIAQLNIEQSAALEQNSDQRLANTLLINQQQTEAVSSAISELENRIAQSNDPAEIAQLLMQIAEQIPEIYRLRRNALSAQFAAGEITLSAINTGIAALNIEESAALERNSDAILTNALRANQDAQTTINTEISALEQAISTSNDPAEITQLLMQIAEQIPEKYRLKREALQAQFDANEITIEQLQNGLAALDIEQAAAFEQNSDAILANALKDHNADVVIISNTIHTLSEEIRTSDDPARIEELVEAIRTVIMEKFRLQREFLQKRLDAEEITVREFQGQLGTLDIQETGEISAVETLGETRVETITRPARSVSQPSRRVGRTTDPAQEAQRAADEALANALRANQDQQGAINVEISRLENVISTSNDPTEIVQLLMQIAEQIPETYRLRREALQTQFDAGKLTQEGLENGIAALNIEESAALEQNGDQVLANALRINQEAVAAINTDISEIENAISQSNDPAEIATLLQQIAEQIPEIYRLRREALQSQYDEGEITLQALQTGLAELGIEESAAVERNSDAMLANALSMNQLAAEAINTHIAGLEERISSSNDPVEIATLLQQVAQQIPEIYRLRREALQRQFNEGEITLSALQTGLAQANIDESAALERNSNEQLANTLGVLNTDAQVINTEINSLSEQIRNSDDPAEIARLVVDLQTAVMEKYRLQREVLQKRLDAEELTIRDFDAQLGSINLAETSELTSAAALGGAETDNLRRTSNALLQNALQRAQFNLTGATSESDFETRRRELLRFIEEYYDAEKARIDALMLSESQLRDQQEDTEFARQRALQQATDATNRFAEDRIQTEERLQDRIEDLRDDAVENEADRQQALQDLAESHQDRLTDIEEDGIRRREDLQRESQRSLEDLRREFQEDQFDVGAQLDRSEITREEAEQQISDLTREFLRDSGDLQRRQRRALEDQGIREERQQEDAAEGFTKSQQQIETEARATATAIQTALTPLLTEQQTGEVAEKQVAAADKQIEAAEGTETAADDLGTVVTGLKDSDIPGAIDLVRQSAEASLGISSAISALPSLLESSFERIFDDLQETIVDILEIESGIQGGVSQYLLDTLIESEGRATGIVGETAAFALQSLGINPEQFAPPEVETDVPLDVKVINPDDLYDPAEIERLREDGRNNREIGVHLREIASLTEPTRPDVSMRGLSDLTARIGAAEALSATREVPTSFTADTVNVSGSVVNVSGENRSGSRESETPQSRFPVEGDELRADITLEFPDGTIQEINNQMLRLKQQDRT